jgi:hypothetical protein
MSASAGRLHSSLSTAGYNDGLGRRSLRFDREVGGMLEALELRPEFSLYEPLIRETARRLGTITDDRLAGARAIDRDGHGLVVCSPLVDGDRLEELLDARSIDEFASSGIEAAIGFMVQALPALALLHDNGIVHGTLAPGRLAVNASGRIVLLDCIYATALERLRLTRDRLWTTLEVAADVTAGGPRFDRGTDLRQLTLIAVAIALGRRLQAVPTPDLVGRLLQEVAEIAQIRAGERFASELRALCEGLMRVRPGSPPALREGLSEAVRLSRVLGTDACVAALANLAAPQLTSVDSPVPAPARPTIARPLAIVAAEPPPVTAAEFEEETVEEPQISLEVRDSVEISLDGLEEPDLHELGSGDDPAILVLDAHDTGSALFDWQPDTIVPRQQAPQLTTPPDAASADPHAFDWAPEPTPIVDAPEWPQVAATAPPTEPHASAPGATAPPEPVPQPSPEEEPPVAVPVMASEFASVAPVVPEVASPAPPPGIPLVRTPAPSPAAAPAAAATPPRPTEPEDRGGLKPYVPPPPRPTLPPPVVFTPPPAPPPPVAFTPAPVFTPPPAPVTVVVAQSPAVGAPAPLRLKPDPVPPRPQRILRDTDDDRAVQHRTLTFAQEPARKAPWKFVAAAVVVLAVGAFAGRPYFTGGTAPAATEAPPPEAPPVTSATKGGGLHIDTQPAGATVLLNGEDVGRTPLKLEDVKPGRHVVTLSTESAVVKRTVRIEAGKTVTLDVPVYSGWVAIYSPIRLHISEGSRMLGTTETTRVMLSPGRHELTLTNRELGYSAKETVDIVAGEERVLNIEPKGTVSVNALPWAEVWVDGTRMGETPLANLEVPLGTREFVFKHPTYGERRLTTTVTSKSPPLSVDFTRPGTRP